MTDRELAGCAQVRLDDDDVAVLTTDAIAYLNGLGTHSSIRMAAAIMQLRSEYADLLSRTPSSEGDGRDGERYRRWRLLAASGTMSEAVCEMMIDARTEDDIDAVIDAASQQDGK